MKRILLGITFVLSSFCIQAQILVVRVDNNGFVQPLSDEDIQKYNQQIVEILLKYTWPTCIAHDLTDEEKVRLLTPDKSGAELKFVREKIKAVSKELDVIFIPTTLYELFVIKTINSLKWSTHSQNPSLFNVLNQKKDHILKKTKSMSPVEYVKQEINKEYNRFNNKIFASLFSSESLVEKIIEYSKGSLNTSILLFHKKFVEYLNIYFLSSFILTKIDGIYKVLYDIRYELMKKILQSQEISDSWLGIDVNDQLGIIKKGIDLDYKGFEKNQALLFRGSNFLNVSALHGLKKILATTVHGVVWQQDEKALVKKARTIPSYSLSFGNSLFAGLYNDQGACAYYYLKSIQDLGYAMFIDKFAYIDNYISNLFFIAPLATEVGLLGVGEWFHSRSKPVILVKKDEEDHIYGLLDTGILDPYGVFLVVRNPYKQAQLFSEYLAKNGVILHKGDYKDLTEEEKNGLVELMKNQQKIGIEYKVVAWFKNLEHKLKQNIFKKKPAPMTEQSKNSELKKQKDSLSEKNQASDLEKNRNFLSEEKQNVAREKKKSTWSGWALSWFK